MRFIEVCANSTHDAVEAYDGGAQRIELCSALEIGGVTPSVGVIESIKQNVPGIKVNVLIRPRGGNFIYSSLEVEEMVRDIKHCKSLGVNGVVIGALDIIGNLDCVAIEKMLAAADGLSVTFHRAFDCCRNPQLLLNQLIKYRFDRVLTSGCAATALQGASLLHELVEQANNKIVIMPGCGVVPENIVELERLTMAKEFHASARDIVKVPNHFRAAVDFGEITKCTSRHIVHQLVNL